MLRLTGKKSKSRYRKVAIKMRWELLRGVDGL